MSARRGQVGGDPLALGLTQVQARRSACCGRGSTTTASGRCGAGGPSRASRRRPRRLDLDHVGAEVPEQRAGERAGEQLPELDRPQAIQRFGHVSSRNATAPRMCIRMTASANWASRGLERADEPAMAHHRLRALAVVVPEDAAKRARDPGRRAHRDLQPRAARGLQDDPVKRLVVDDLLLDRRVRAERARADRRRRRRSAARRARRRRARAARGPRRGRARRRGRRCARPRRGWARPRPGPALRAAAAPRGSASATCRSAARAPPPAGAPRASAHPRGSPPRAGRAHAAAASCIRNHELRWRAQATRNVLCMQSAAVRGAPARSAGSIPRAAWLGWRRRAVDHSPGRSLGGRGSFQPGPRIVERNQGTQRGAGFGRRVGARARGGGVVAKGADERRPRRGQDEQDQRDREVETARAPRMVA